MGWSPEYVLTMNIIGYGLGLALPLIFVLIVAVARGQTTKRSERVSRKRKGRIQPTTSPEMSIYQRAERLERAIKEAMKHAPISRGQKTLIRKQTREVLTNIAQGNLKIQRLRKLTALMRDATTSSSSTELSELATMEKQLIGQMNHATELLSPIPVSLMKVEFAQDDRVNRIITELTEFNKRMGELAESYQDLNRSTG